jgi:predicted amidohydrolase
VIAQPAAFTVPTGEAHWHVLLRARAIETGAFVVAAAQCGAHEDGRETYGHSLVIDPWGRVLLDMGREPGEAIVELDLGMVAEARARIPNLRHARPIEALSIAEQAV